MNILSKLPFVKGTTDDEVAEIDEAQARKDRIAFHRDHVRNGPAKFKGQTTGQVRREKKRELARETRRARRVQIRKYHAEQREAAILRGHLQHAGIVSYSGIEFEVGPRAVVNSIAYLVARFAPAPVDGSGQIEVTRKVVIDALTEALNRFQTLTGQPTTRLSPAYVLPVTFASEMGDDEAAEFARAVSQA